MRRALASYAEWYNAHRPHRTLGGRTPDEVYHGELPANEQPRYEPRRRYPRNGHCAGPPAKVKGRRGVRPLGTARGPEPVEGLALVVIHLEGRKHLPVVELKPAA